MENKFLENKSGRIFCVQQVYKFFSINLDACKPFFYYYFLYTPHLRRKSTMRRCFYHTDLYKMQYFTIFQDKLHSAFNIQDHRGTRRLLLELLKNFSKSTIRPAGCNFWQAPNLRRNFKRVTLQRDKEFIESIFY